MPRKTKAVNQQIADEPQADSREIILSIQPGNDKALNATQREFNRLVQSIEQTKREMERVKAVVQKTRDKVLTELAPLFAELKEKQLAWLHRLDEIHDTMSLTKGQKKTLAAFILNEAEQLSEVLDDEFVDSLLEKYETEEDMAFREEREQMANQLFEKLFGFNPNDEDAEEKTEAFFERMHERMAGNPFGGNWDEPEQKSSKKETARQKRMKEEAQMEAKDVRSIYTSLAKALHPDLESDPKVREEKTELMKKVTQAYERNDLYELMRLQLEHNSQGMEKMADIVEEQLKRYCKVLRKQLSQLQTEFWEYTQQSDDAKIISDFLTYKYDFSAAKFRSRKKRLLDDINHIQAYIDELRDKKGVVYFLKVIKQSYWF
ncbi:hypothetical protein [Rhodoflexus caldus]|uniref:hypothetical protein n=1 Tax=Rhodoflexus caldus TaxID=2891236 RepID=UPI00202A81D6|nr:hypothetical protein [Rhodoflexus caldus]